MHFGLLGYPQRETITFHVLLQLRECGVWLSSNIFCTAMDNKLNLVMNRGRRPRGGGRQWDETWDNLEAEMAAKRTKADTLARSKAKRGSVPHEIVVQKLASEPDNKQKYKPLQPREFVPFEYNELTLANLKSACAAHFRLPAASCDILVSDKGPSCTNISQIPHRKDKVSLVHPGHSLFYRAFVSRGLFGHYIVYIGGRPSAIFGSKVCLLSLISDNSGLKLTKKSSVFETIFRTKADAILQGIYSLSDIFVWMCFIF